VVKHREHRGRAESSSSNGRAVASAQTTSTLESASRSSSDAASWGSTSTAVSFVTRWRKTSVVSPARARLRGRRPEVAISKSPGQEILFYVLGPLSAGTDPHVFFVHSRVSHVVCTRRVRAW